MRADIARELLQWGNAFSIEMLQGTQALFAPLIDPIDEMRVRRHISYGSDDRHRLDLFEAADGAEDAPLILFVHGGGFVMGGKGGPGDPYHNNIGAWATRQGFDCATINYRLAPMHQWPAGRDDVLLAARFLAEFRAQHRRYGKIFLMGQSAGATHVADAAVADNSSSPVIGGAIMVSGIYDPSLGEPDHFRTAYYGTEPLAHSRAAALSRLPERSGSMLYSVSEFDPPDFQAQASALVNTHVARSGGWPAIHWLEGHNHLSSVCQLGTAGDDLGPIIRNFVEERRR